MEQEGLAFRWGNNPLHITSGLRRATTQATTAIATTTEARSAEATGTTLTAPPIFIVTAATMVASRGTSIITSGRTTATVGTTEDSEQSDQRDKEASPRQTSQIWRGVLTTPSLRN